MKNLNSVLIILILIVFTVVGFVMADKTEAGNHKDSNISKEDYSKKQCKEKKKEVVIAPTIMPTGIPTEAPTIVPTASITATLTKTPDATPTDVQKVPSEEKKVTVPSEIVNTGR